jgi:hypothetical protein
MSYVSTTVQIRDYFVQRKQFLALDFCIQGHIHAGLRSAPLHNKAYVRRYEKRLKELQDAREAARAAWYEARDQEPVVVQTRQERMVKAAQGHEDLESTQAARRICERNGWKYETD